MLTFLTFFLTLTTGLHTVDLAASPEIARIEILINGIPAGEDTAAPWSVEVDFGGGLRTHELTAVGYDAGGEEVARTTTPVNRPGPRAQARLALLGKSRGRLVWDSVEKIAPRRVTLILDGRELPQGADHSFSLPDLDLEKVHYLVATVEFSSSVRAEAAVRLGGQYGDGVATQRTSLVIDADPEWEPPAVEAMAGWFHYDGVPLRVELVETGGADVLMVRDRDSLARLRTKFETVSPLHKGWIGWDDRFWLVDPVPDPTFSPTAQAALFPLSIPLRADQHMGFRDFLAFRVIEGKTQVDVAQRLADAVSAAALEAARGRPRAVLLVTRHDTVDHSRHSESEVESFLRELQVPLYVWRLGRAKAPGPWSGAVEVRDLGDLRRAVNVLGQDLRRQWVVWLDGAVPADGVELSQEARRAVRTLR